MILFVNDNKGILFLGGIIVHIERVVEWLIHESRITIHLIFNS
jgi:hypothetical protein